MSVCGVGADVCIYVTHISVCACVYTEIYVSYFFQGENISNIYLLKILDCCFSALHMYLSAESEECSIPHLNWERHLSPFPLSPSWLLKPVLCCYYSVQNKSFEAVELQDPTLIWA